MISFDKCRSRAAEGQFSNADNMAVVGILSTQLVYHHFIHHHPEASAPSEVRTVVDRLGAPIRGGLMSTDFSKTPPPRRRAP